MAVDNLAIEMRPLHGDHVIDIEHNFHDDFVGDPENPEVVIMRTKKMNGSYAQLITHEDENPRKSLTASVRESVQSTVSKISKVKKKWWRKLKPLKTILFKLKLLFVIALYSLFGAWLFMYLEVPTDLANKEIRYNQRFIARDNLVISLRDIHQANRENREEKWKEAILSFEKNLDMDEPMIETSWTFWMSFLYAGTIFTTIGYGNIACATTAGQVATVLYAIFGIPIMIVILNDLGDVLLFIVKGFTHGVGDLTLFISVKIGLYGLEENTEQRKRFNHISRKLGRFGMTDTSSMSTLTTQDALTKDGEDDEDPLKRDPPVIQAVVATFGWILFASAVFCLWEDWSYWTSIYFFFISTSTIGLGDVTPAHPEYMIATFMIVIVGLSLVNVCINVVCEKLEMMYLALLTKMAEDYQRALETGDPKAMEGMMSGFQGKAKFLLPLISKNAGNKVMNQFKEEAKAKGIDIPPVLTNLDPQTGMPAFAKADRGDFKDFIEAAEVKKQQQDRIDQLFTERQGRTTSMSRAMLVNTSMATEEPKIKKEVIEVACQAWSMDDLFCEWKPNIHVEVQTRPEMVEEHSYGAQALAESNEMEIQVSWDLIDEGIQCTSDYTDSEVQTSRECVDEGIQVWSSMEEVSTQYDPEFLEGIHVQTQAIEIEERGCQCEPSTSGVTEIGTQPEVSMLYHEIDDDEDLRDDLPSTPTQSVMSSVSEWSLFEGLDSEDEAIRKEEMKLQREAPELENIRRQFDEWSSDMSDIDPLGAEMEEKERKRLWSEKVRLHEEKLRKLEERKKQRDEKRQKKREEYEAMKKQRQEEREKRRKAKEEERQKMRNQIRFMKNSGDQTDHLAEFDEKPEIEQSSATTQTFEAEKFGKRTQTKLTSIEPSELQALQKKQQSHRSSTLTAMGPSFSAVTVSLSSLPPSPQPPLAGEKPIEKTRQDSDGLPVVEVSADFNFVKIPVDEYGIEVFSSDDYDKEVGDDNVFYSDEEDMKEMEAYSINQQTQTEQPQNRQRQTQVSAVSLGLLCEGITQTTVSGFKQVIRPKLPRQERISMTEVVEQVLEQHELIGEPSSSDQTATSEAESAKESEAEVSDEWRQRLSRKETLSEKKSFEIMVPEIAIGDEEIYFQKETGAQTERSGFMRKELSRKSDEIEQTDEIVRFMVTGTSQTDFSYESNGAQTEDFPRSDVESQTFVECADFSEQTMIEYATTSAQSVVTKIHEQAMTSVDTTDTAQDIRFMVSSSTQFELDLRDVETQICPTMATISTEYSIDTKEASTTVKPEVSSVEISCVPQVSSTGSSTTKTIFSETSIQAVVEMADRQTQIKSYYVSTQAGPSEPEKESVEVQTDEHPDWMEYPSQALWSDFDVVLGEEQTATEPDASSDGGLLEGDAWVEELMGPPLWSDFDVVIGDEKSQTQSEIPSEAPSMAQSRENLNRRGERRRFEEFGAQTDPIERHDRAIGTDDQKWKKLFLDELEKEKKAKRRDIGIQTGVLSRVEHLYGKKVTLTSEEDEAQHSQSTSQPKPPQPTRLESFGEGVKKASSDESLQMQRAAEPRPFGKKRSTSFKKLKSLATERRDQEKQQTVQDLRSRFEKARLEQQMRKRDSSTE